MFVKRSRKLINEYEERKCNGALNLKQNYKLFYKSIQIGHGITQKRKKID